MYQSLTMGNVVDTKREVIAQVFESLFRFGTIDFRWEKVKRKTGCFDVSGCEICYGDLILIKSKLTNQRIIVRFARSRPGRDGGFRARYGKGNLIWNEDDHDACYEVMKLF